MRGSTSLEGVPEYLSTRLMRTVAEARERGVDVIALGMGNPDTPPPAELREELCAQARRDEIHGYPTEFGIAPLREAVAARCAAASVELDPAREICRCWARRKASRTSASPSSIPAMSRWSPSPDARSTTAEGTGGQQGRRPSPARRERLPARSRGHRRRFRAAGGAVDLRVPEQPDGRGGRRRLLRAPGRLGRQTWVPICHDNAYGELTYDGLVAPSFLASARGA